MLTEDQLRRIMPNLPAAKAAGLLPHLNRAMAEYGINTMQRAAAFVAQLAHESGELRWMEEIWGPTPTQRLYEPASRIAKVLGNTQPGDGNRFKGRGPIQITGRDNYQRFGRLLGLDLISAPERAADPEVAFRVAAVYWEYALYSGKMDGRLPEIISKKALTELNHRGEDMSWSW